MRRLNAPGGRAQGGFTLIEVIISFVVLAVGLLGVASMQKRGVESNHNAYLRTQAVSLANDMASRVRANTAGMEAGNYNAPAAQETAACLAAGCTAAQMAGNDYFEWSRDIQNMLPQGEGVVCLDSTPDDGSDAANAACDGVGTELAIKIWWDAIPRDGTVDQRYAIGVDI
ncbi:type IV pilus modification protein PilV [Teredinibacter turnerae]|uniref:Type IV pilus modification protein PilV n=1 Tax=Teredinibacter turnerae (strain ATCC 39867 / T7901) TaxID=377629 RepID=C5BPS5_TERTT|nr:type IV pilus modification protein PilV [Teredinibacter turnerae]ACR11141.1 type IV pilus modification protein PilV [Teredinibacter turnerae T7901]